MTPATQCLNYPLPRSCLRRFRQFGFTHLGLDPEPMHAGHGTTPPPHILFFTRTKGRSFHNLDELIAIATKYHMPYTIVAETDLLGLNFREQAAKVGHYGIVVAIHGAGETLFGFLAKRAVVIEVSPMGMWCPIYHKYLTAIGHTVLPIYSRLKSPGVNWEFMTADPRPEKTDEFWKQCEGEDLITATRSRCWAESKSMGSIVVPIYEFEHALIRGLDLIGVKVYPQFSPIDMLHGIAQGEHESSTASLYVLLSVRDYAFCSPRPHTC